MANKGIVNFKRINRPDPVRIKRLKADVVCKAPYNISPPGILCLIYGNPIGRDHRGSISQLKEMFAQLWYLICSRYNRHLILEL